MGRPDGVRTSVGSWFPDTRAALAVGAKEKRGQATGGGRKHLSTRGWRDGDQIRGAVCIALEGQTAPHPAGRLGTRRPPSRLLREGAGHRHDERSATFCVITEPASHLSQKLLLGDAVKPLPPNPGAQQSCRAAEPQRHPAFAAGNSDCRGREGRSTPRAVENMQCSRRETTFPKFQWICGSIYQYLK